VSSERLLAHASDANGSGSGPQRREAMFASVRESGFGFEGIEGEVVDCLDVACMDAAESKRNT
jgi:hypothetical protein